MLRRTFARSFAASRALLSGGGGSGHGVPADYHHNAVDKYRTDKDFPNMPHDITESHYNFEAYHRNPFIQKMFDQSIPMYDDTVTGFSRVLWQEPARQWNLFNIDDTLILQEHDKEEFNNKPYVGVAHLYEPPAGCEDRPLRLEANGNPGDQQVVMCLGNCAPHIPQSNYVMMMKGYAKNKCPMCQQWFYIHNRPWLMMHPDWTDEPAADEGPAYTFAEIESEFDRDFHEFALYLNME